MQLTAQIQNHIGYEQVQCSQHMATIRDNYSLGAYCYTKNSNIQLTAQAGTLIDCV